jgi:hypothetical protein
MSAWWMVPVAIAGGWWCAWALCKSVPKACDDCGTEAGLTEYEGGDLLCANCRWIRIHDLLDRFRGQRVLREKAGVWRQNG